MGYQCGIGEGMQRFGFQPGDPYIFCDGCGARYDFLRRRMVPPAWFLDGKPPPKWKQTKIDGKRRDFCPRCKKTP